MSTNATPRPGRGPRGDGAAAAVSPVANDYADPAVHPPSAARVGITPRSLGAHARLIELPARRRNGLLSRVSAASQAIRRRFYRRP